MRRLVLVASTLAATLSVLLGCGAVGDIAGNTASCDRRAPAAAAEPRPTCQELVESVAIPQFRGECQERLKGKYAENKCPRDKAVGGCEVGGAQQDGSKFVEWFYDVTGDPNASKYPATDVAKSISDVRRFCADSKRYEKGARLVAP